MVQHWVVLPMETIRALSAFFKVYLGDGMVLVRAGESLRFTGVASAQDTGEACAPEWTDWPRDLLQGLSAGGEHDRPARPPTIALEKRWYFVGCGGVDEIAERRDIKLGVVDKADWAANIVVVLREGLAMPTSTLTRVVNTAHAVLVLRGSASTEYFYLHDGFVLSADEEDSMREWGVGRALFASMWLAVGGTLLVALANPVWQPLVVGTLLVAAAGYRVEGALTKVLRVTSAEWERHELVPSGIHGTERAVQLVLVTLVALADLLESRKLLLWALGCATVNVVAIECTGQVVVTWGFRRYRGVLLEQSRDWTLLGVGSVAFLWISYVFAGAIFWLALGQAGRATLFVMISCPNEEVKRAVEALVFVGVWAVACWVGVMDWDEADLKTSPRSLQPWAWPVARAPDSVVRGLRLASLWSVVVGYCIAFVRLAPLMFSFSISSDRTAESERAGVRGERTRARKIERKFSHYHTSSIPSRNRFCEKSEQSEEFVGCQGGV